MTPLMTGIFSLFNVANDFKTAIGGRLYHMEAPQGATFPYCVMFAVSSEHDWTFDDTFEDVLVQFSIFSQESSAVNIGTYWTKLTALFDDATPTVSGYTSLYMIRNQSILLREAKDNVWHYMVEYDCKLEQT